MLFIVGANMEHTPRKTVSLDELSIESVNDLYQTVMVPDYYDEFDGRTIYQYLSVWGVIKDFETFETYLNWLTPEQVIDFRNEDDGCILLDMALAHQPEPFWKLVYDKIGNDAFCEMLIARHRTGIAPIVLIKDFDLFKILISMIRINGRFLRDFGIHATNQELEYLAEIINLFHES